MPNSRAIQASPWGIAGARARSHEQPPEESLPLLPLSGAPEPGVDVLPPLPPAATLEDPAWLPALAPELPAAPADEDPPWPPLPAREDELLAPPRLDEPPPPPLLDDPPDPPAKDEEPPAPPLSDEPPAPPLSEDEPPIPPELELEPDEPPVGSGFFTSPFGGRVPQLPQGLCAWQVPAPLHDLHSPHEAPQG
jgi:hypothetical protein